MKISGTKERQRLVGSCEGGKGRGSYLTFFALGPTRRQEGSCYPENRLHRYCSFVYRYRVHFCRHREEGIRRHLGGGGLDKKPRKKGRDTRYNFERNPFARVYICTRIDKPTKGHLSFLFAPAPSSLLAPFFLSNFKRESLFLRNMHEYESPGFILHVSRLEVFSRNESSLDPEIEDRFVVLLYPDSTITTALSIFFFKQLFYTTTLSINIYIYIYLYSFLSRLTLAFSVKQTKLLEYTSIFPTSFYMFLLKPRLFIAKQTIRHPIK